MSSVCLADCKNNTVAEEQKQLAWLVMETLTVLLQGSNTTNTNAGKRSVHEGASLKTIMPSN